MGFMESNRALAAVGLVVVLILAIILGTLFYLNKTFHTTPTSTPRLAVSSPVPALPSTNHTPAPSSNPVTGNSSVTQVVGNSKSYNGTNFRVTYPSSWGLLTCANSQNFELDPAS